MTYARKISDCAVNLAVIRQFDEELAAVRELLSRTPDVVRVIELVPAGSGRFRFFIETEEEVLPKGFKFAIGTLNAAGEDVVTEWRSEWKSDLCKTD